METKNYTRFVVCSMTWTVITVATLGVVVTAFQTPGPFDDILAALVVVIGFGLLLAFPVGLVTWAFGWPVLNAVFRLLDPKWPQASVELAGASVAVVPVLLIVFFGGEDFDLFSSPLLSYGMPLILGGMVGAVMSNRLLRLRVSSEVQS